MSAKLAGKRKRGSSVNYPIVIDGVRPYKRSRARGPVYRGGGGELKFHDFTLNDAVVAAGGVITATINVIPQGISEVQRIGRKCTVTNVHWRYNYSLPELDAVVTPGPIDFLRVILYQDKQANGATAATTDILEAADIYSFRNLANSGRFNILMDKVHPMSYTTLASDGAGVVSSAGVTRWATFNKKCSIPLEFSGADGTIDEIRSNNLGVLLICPTGTIGFFSKFRLRFTDV